MALLVESEHNFGVTTGGHHRLTELDPLTVLKGLEGGPRDAYRAISSFMLPKKKKILGVSV
jgi:hypothetical protein